MAIGYREEGRIAIFTIDRPDAMNALNAETHRELHDGMMSFRDNPGLWVAIITGAGDRAFCAGEDISGVRSLQPGVGSANSSYNVADTIWKPFIAAINGYCLGGGLELALTCDIRIAAENARFGQPEINIGVIPGGGGTQRLPRFIPRARAAEMILMGRRIDAQEAYRLGLVNEVVPQEQLMPTAMKWAETICQAAPLAVSASKEAMIKGFNKPLEDGLQLEADLFTGVAKTEDCAEGVNAFLEKRKPTWKGK